MNEITTLIRRSVPIAARLAGMWLCLTIGGCTATGGSPGLLDSTLGIVGLKRSNSPSAPGELHGMPPKVIPDPPRKIVLRMQAGSGLNLDGNGRSLSLIVKLYKLRNADAFENQPYEGFHGSGPSPAWAADVVEAREVVLTPGKLYEIVEPVDRSIPYLGVVALYRAPAERRWRFVFDTDAAAQSGLTLGAHTCALSVSTGAPLHAAPELLRVAGVRCPGFRN